ncbi:MAG: hypothetical protein ACLPKB_31800 [Xanthobacteraceae bacterium]
MNTLPQQRIRYVCLGISGALMTLAIWLMLAEIIRPQLPSVPADATSAPLAAAERGRATWAARFGMVRGDLWTECALTYTDLLWPESPTGGREQSETIGQALTYAQRALRYSPHDARAWLLVASYDSISEKAKSASVAALKMSYYTAPNQAELTPLRLWVSLWTRAIEDGEIREMVGREIRTVITYRPELKPVIGAAYRLAPPPGRRVIEATLAELDPKFLSDIRAGNAGQAR